MRQDLAIQKIEEYQYEPPGCWLNILEEEYARLMGKEVKIVNATKKKKKDSKKSKKDSKTGQSKKNETRKYCDESKLGNTILFLIEVESNV